jgi:hypothetical protein
MLANISPSPMHPQGRIPGGNKLSISARKNWAGAEKVYMTDCASAPDFWRPGTVSAKMRHGVPTNDQAEYRLK